MAASEAPSNQRHSKKPHEKGLCKKSRRDYIYVENAKKYFAPFHRNGIVRAKDAVPTERGKILFADPTEIQSLRDFLHNPKMRLIFSCSTP
jgi:hypothetical protein